MYLEFVYVGYSTKQCIEFLESIEEKLRAHDKNFEYDKEHLVIKAELFKCSALPIYSGRLSCLDEIFLEDYIRNIIHRFELTSKAFSNFRTLIYGIFKYAKHKKYISFSITYTMSDMEISKKAFKHSIKIAENEVYMPDEKNDMERYLENNIDITNLGLLFMFKTGVRVGELATLKRSDVRDYTVAINATETRYKDENGNVHYDVKDFPKSEAGLRFAILPEKYKWILDEILSLNPDGYYLFEKNFSYYWCNWYMLELGGM